MKELIAIQSGLKVPKNQRNEYGNFNYRSAEDILEAVKPLLKEVGCILTITDELIMVGDRFYIKATATITNLLKESISTSSFAREDETKKKMDGPQITGAASSYARKYALNGLLCIDDTKDSDSLNSNKKEDKNTDSQNENENINYREELVEFTQSKKLDMIAIAKEFKINKSTTNPRFKEVLEQLKAKK